ncbi:universal stress protein [Solirubrobacter sp. CPCC 204708]|uniref:Universal stress protein n=1 Tax=Solirubrobacter deserti TaxID=2282478 RepID=A0ABT4RE59_9ACTN|nr:universal stress protein [Solirubrobacter deserti]MBE2316066.1 universal stress protein [Solirubrobacter deserti]MDA0136818.1 universal stress protein [Solirubrobacter deserti]
MQRVVLAACDEDRSPVAFARSVAPLLGARVVPVRVGSTGELAGVEPDAGGPAIVGVRVERAASAAAGLQRLIATDRPVLTVLGSAHDAPHGRVRVGGTVERVLHGACGAVAVVPRGYGERPLAAVGVGLLPTTDSRRALRAASALARAAGTPLSVLTVLRRSPDPADAARFAASLAPLKAPWERGDAASILRAAIEAAAREDEPELEVEPLVLVGDPTDTLLRASAQLDVLVLGSRAYGPPGVVLPGGAALGTLAGARCPVMVVPRADAGEDVRHPPRMRRRHPARA